MSSIPWLGHDEHGGVPSQPLPDRTLPPHWRLDAIYATQRPHHPVASPDGSRVAFVLSSGAESDIYLVDSEGGHPRRLTTDRALASFWEDSAPVWSPDGTRLAYTSGSHGYVVAVEGGPPLRITDVSVGAWLDDRRLVVVVERKRTSRLAAVDVDDPWPQPFGPEGGDVGQVVPIGDGRVLATFWPKDDKNRSDVVVADPDGEYQTLVGHDDRRALDAVARDGKVAYVLEDGDWRAVYLTDLEGDEHGLIARADADFGELTWAPNGEKLAAIRSRRGKADLVTIDLDGEVTELGAGGFWQTPTWEGSAIVAIHEAHDIAPRLVSIVDGQTTTLLDGAPAAVGAAPHAAYERVVFASSDGLEIEGLLMRPDDVSKPVPAVVYPHGGPTSVYGEEWDGHAQYFVDKGYAWLGINFRGSTTYGVEFERANHDDWGVGDTADCIAAGRYLAGLDWVDGDRLAIFGASYGSYMTVTSLVHPDNPFACGVAKYGDCNILTSWAQGDRVGVEDLERMMGHPSQNRNSYHAGSPIHAIERIDRPILIAHGEKDARVNVKQAEELVAALKRLDKTYEYVTYPEEAHGFLRRPSQIHFYKRMERFLDWHLL
jgi:dipeptidyl aminopeptidase/acylaminoacyl peptidase